MGEMHDEFYSGVDDVRNNKTHDDHEERNGRIIIRNISYRATNEALKEHFSKFGTVNEVNLLKRPDGKLVGCGFVHYADVAAAEKAIAATNRKPFLDRPIHVAFALSKKSYVQNLQNNANMGRFSTVSTDNEKPKFKREKPERPTKPKEEKKKTKVPYVNRNARLIVRNVSFNVTEEALKEHFQPYGEVLETKLLKKPDGKLVGCAFVLFKNVPMAKKALLNTNMKPFLDRPISVDWAVPKNKYMQHQVSQQIEMEENIKQEDSDSDDDDQKPLNVSGDDIKAEVKSESDSDAESDEDSDDEKDSDQEQDSEEDQSEQDSEEGEESDDEEDEDMDEDMDEEEEEVKVKPESQRIKLNDAEDGCTVFITNIPFSVDNDQLREFAERTGPVKYALICIDRMTEHSKGSGFVKFANNEHAEAFLSLPADQLRIDGQVMQVKPALKRENLQKGDKKEAKDNRNLYLVKEGVVVAGTKAAVGVSSSDMSKRLALERSKTQMLKNLNRFVSRYRLVVSNLPAHFDDAQLRRLCGAGGAAVTECRVMRDLRSPPGKDGKNPSKGYGFVMFTRHEDALACLRKLNNNPDVFDKNNRPIVSFSIEDRTALNARKKRLEKSIANNPLTRQDGNTYEATTDNKNKRNRKRKTQAAPDESYAAAKRRKFGKNKFNNQNSNTDYNENKFSNNKFNRNPNTENNDNNFGNNKFNQNYNTESNNNKFVNKFNRNQNTGNNDKFGGNKFNRNQNTQNNGQFGRNKFNRNQNQENYGKFVKHPDEIGEYTGLTAKQGAQHKMRSNHKLKAQADIHRQTVKMEKKKSKRTQRFKMAAKERVKQPKQKVNKNPNKKRNKKFKPKSKFEMLRG